MLKKEDFLQILSNIIIKIKRILVFILKLSNKRKYKWKINTIGIVKKFLLPKKK
jgi:bacteriorhodopsin